MKKILSLIIALIIVTTSFSAVAVSAAEFTDIDASHWAFESVTKLTNDGTINGYSDGSFKPEGTVTRAEFVKMLGKSPEIRNNDFADVDKSHWAYDYVMYSGLEGDEENKFNPDAAILRSDVANLLYKRFSNGTDAIAPYPISSQGTDTKATAWVYTYGLMVGDDMINLRLNDTITRAEAAVLIVRAKILDTSKQRNFIDNFSDETYKAVYEGSNIFDTEYKADDNITNGEMALAALRFRFKKRAAPLGMYYYTKAYEGDYAAEWDIMCNYVLPKDKYTSSENESKSNATVVEAIAMLSHAASNDPYTKLTLSTQNEKIYQDINISGDGDYERCVKNAYAYGISLYADGKINPDKAITKKELACILMQYDLTYGANIAYRCGRECTYVPASVRNNVSGYPINKDYYSSILNNVPNTVYEAAFTGNVTEKSKDISTLAQSMASVFIIPFTTVSSVAYKAGVDMYITFIPSLMAKVEGGYTYRVKFEFEKAPEGALLSDIFPLADGVEDVALGEGVSFWADLTTNAELAGLYIDWQLMSVEQIIK